MAEGDLPVPVTREQEYLQAIYDELRALTAEVKAQRPQSPEGLTELREPVASVVEPPKPAPKPRRKKRRGK